MIITKPATKPVTTPVPAPTVARAGILLVQLPPPASLKVVVDPTQTCGVPDIDDGNGLTVIALVMRQSGDN